MTLPRKPAFSRKGKEISSEAFPQKFKRHKMNGKKIMKKAENLVYREGMSCKLSPKAIKAVRSAIRKSKGLLTHASDMLGISYTSLKSKIDAHPEIAEVYIEQMERNLDNVEKRLLGAAVRKFPWAIKYYLDNKGGERGYGKGLPSVAGKVSGGVFSSDEVGRLSISEIRDLVDLIERAKKPPELINVEAKEV